MSTFCCEMITLAFPFWKNEISVDIEFMYQNRSAIIVMDQALINICEEAISENNTLQANLPDRYSYNSVNELVQAIESIILPQSPHAIAHRQFLFQTITQNEGESTSDLMQRIYAYLRMFEYTLRPKDCVELIACMNVAFKDIYLFEQARDDILTKSRNNALDLRLLLRHIGEAEMARKASNGGVNAVSSARNFVHMGQVECKELRNRPNDGTINSRSENRGEICLRTGSEDVLRSMPQGAAMNRNSGRRNQRQHSDNNQNGGRSERNQGRM